MIAVVDASVAVAFLLGEPLGVALESALEAVRDGKARVVVPALFWYEITNVLVLASQKAGKLPAPLDDLLQLADDLPFETDDDFSPGTRRRLAALAVKHRLTAYDAAYLELAIRSRASQLRTLDRSLLALAGDYPVIGS